MVYVTAIHLAGGSGHEHISDVQWRNPADGNTGQSSKATMVDWIKNKAGDARVTDGTNEVQVGVVEGTPPYIRTYADGTWTDNLLALPQF
jgi:Protein of unknown function (DUF3892)